MIAGFDLDYCWFFYKKSPKTTFIGLEAGGLDCNPGGE